MEIEITLCKDNDTFSQSHLVFCSHTKCSWTLLRNDLVKLLAEHVVVVTCLIVGWGMRCFPFSRLECAPMTLG